MKLSITILSLFLLFGCKDSSKNSFAFYHWKSSAKFSDSYKKVIKITDSKTIYLHYFDIKNTKKSDWKNDGVFPTYVLKHVDKEFQKFNIIPVIYITNHVLKTKNLKIKRLSDRIKNLINQISEKHFGREIKQIQIDCDWTKSTKNTYFELLKILKKKFEIDVTIRLHQIKFQKKTGIPPVEKGTLMLYNIGDLKDKNQNSILENKIVKKYIDKTTSYPLKLNIGLPIFSQTIVTNNDNHIKIIRNTNREILENDKHFKQINKTNFVVKKDTLYKGFYLSENYNLKLENISENEIINSYKTISDSELQIKNIIFYHLDKKSLSNIDLKKIMGNLK